MKIDELNLWEAFESVATQGNFSKAAAFLKVGTPQLSKRVARLEEMLGVRLFYRSTRVVSLTDDGKALLPKVRSALEDLKSIENSFENQQSLGGTIRITTVPFIAHRLLIPAISKFKKRHPQVQFEVHLGETLVNLLELNIDLAIRIHEKPEDSNLVYKKLIPNRLILCASATYLKNSKDLKKPSDLKNHRLLYLDVHRGCHFADGSYRLSDLSIKKEIECENGDFLTQLALNHFGILIRSEIDVREHIERGDLVQILKKYPLSEFGSIFAVLPNRKLLAPKVRTFLDFILQESALWA